MRNGESGRLAIRLRGAVVVSFAIVLVMGCLMMQGCSSSRTTSKASASSAAASAPAATSQASASTSTVQSASNEIIVPDVVGMNLSEAKEQLKDFKLDYLKADGSDAHVVISSNWRVDAQSIEPGTAVAKKTVLVLTLGHIPDEEAAAKQQAREEQQAAERASIEYIDVSVSQMVADLESNAMVAKETYKDGYYRITGVVSNIDANGEYINLRPEDNPYSWTNVQCFIHDEGPRDAVRQIADGQTVTLCGKVTNVGEVLGYSIDVYFFE